MNSKTVGTLALAAVLCALLCTAFAQQPAKIPNAVEEPKQPQLLNVASLPGRYQVTALGNGGYFVLVDTHTGHCWQKSLSTAWQDLGSPVQAEDATAVPRLPQGTRDSTKRP